ncbi:MAG: hypothetical protein ACPGSO_00605 [Vicingaceae bacterium]
MANTIVITKLSNGNVLVNNSGSQYTLLGNNMVERVIDESLVYITNDSGSRIATFRVSDVEKVVRADGTEVSISDIDTLFTELYTYFFFKPVSSGGGGGGDVDSVFGRTGDVTSQENDYASFYDRKRANVYVVNEGESIQDKLDYLDLGQALEVCPNPGIAYSGFTHNRDVNNLTIQGTTNWNGDSYASVISGDVSVLDGERFRFENLQINGNLVFSNNGNNWIVECFIGGTSNFSGTTGLTSVYRVNFGGAITGNATTLFTECGVNLVANLPTNAVPGSYLYVTQTNSIHYRTALGSWEDSGENTWASAIGSLKFTKYTVDENNTPFTIPKWSAIVELKNGVSDLEVILPAFTSSNINKEIKFWAEHNTSNHKITVKAPNILGVINGVASSGSEVAKAEYKDDKPNYFRFTAQLIDNNDVNVDQATSVFNLLIYVINVNHANDFTGPYSYLEADSVPLNFATNNASWWIAKKLESPILNDSNIRTMFTTPDYGVGVQGNGQYFGTTDTSGFLQSISPNTIPENGNWIIYQYDHVNDEYTAWINGVKVLDATSSGTTPPSSAPSALIFYSQEPNTGWSSPSGFLYPMRTNVKFSNISLGSGLLSDADAALFTSSVFDCPTLTGGTLTNQWSFADSDVVTTVTGAIDLTLVGASINTEEL